MNSNLQNLRLSRIGHSQSPAMAWRLAGYYVGREFKFVGVRAVWMASQGQIKFYGDDGRVLRAVEVGQGGAKKAA